MLSITGIEVIRGNHDSNMELAVQAAPGEKVELTYGDSLRVNVRLDYKGPALEATLYGAIGVRGIGFDERVAGDAPAHFTKSDVFTPWSGSVEIPITADIKPGTNYDIYCKLKEYPGAGMPRVDDVITITGIPPTFELLEETIYPYAYVYDGPCDVSTFTFKTDLFTPASWIAGRLATHVKDEVRKAGGRVMEMRVYVDKSPLLWTDWRIEVVGVPAATAGLGTSLGIAWWAIAILAALAIALIIVITWLLKTIVSSFTHKTLSEEIKKTWSRETLISVIGDFEEKLKRTPTPPEDLEKKSDDELRTYCDQLAETIAPAPGLGLVIAAVGVLGALTLVGFAMAKRET